MYTRCFVLYRVFSLQGSTFQGFDSMSAVNGVERASCDVPTCKVAASGSSHEQPQLAVFFAASPQDVRPSDRW
jgi:hypothetical protein